MEIKQNAPCLACGSRESTFWASATDLEYNTSKDIFHYHLCRGCDSIFIQEPPVNRLGEIYPKNYYSFAHSKSLLSAVKAFLDRRRLKKILAPMQGSTLAVLDVGGGTGWIASLARQADSRVTDTLVVDLEQMAEEEARAAGHDFIAHNIETLRLNRKFDLIIALNLLEHVSNPLQVLKAMKSMLTLQGKILLKTPNHSSLDARLFRHKNWAGLHCPRHWVLFTPESLTKLAHRASLRVERISMTQGAPFWGQSVAQLLAKKGWIHVSKERPLIFHPIMPMLFAFFAVFDTLRGGFSLTSQFFALLSSNSSSTNLP